MPRQRKPKIIIELPTPAPHPHPEGCDCIPTVPYIRVSRVGDRKFLISPEIQMSSMDEWALRNKRRLLPPVCDINKSGTSFRKRSVDKIIEDIRRNEYKHVALWKWSRWARNQEESAVYLKKIRDAGGRVDSATEDADQDTAIGQLTLGVTAVVDQYQSRLMSETWHNVHAMRRDDGLPHGGRERFGYDYVESVIKGVRTKRYTANPEADDLVKAYTDWLDSRSYQRIAQDLNKAGWVTTLGGTWTPQGVARMMDTGFAAGWIRERSPEMNLKIARKEVGANAMASYDIWRKGSHDPILEQSVWEEYKARRLAGTNLPPRSKRPVHALSALMFCSECRRRLTTKYAGAGRTHQWQCPYQKSFHPQVAVTVNNRLSLDLVRDWVRAEIGDELPIEKFTSRAREEQAARAKASSQDRKAKVKGSLRQTEIEIENLIDVVAKLGGAIADAYNHKIARLLETKSELETELRSMTTKARPEKNVETLRKLDQVWEELPPTVLHEGLAVLIARIEVSPRTPASTRSSVVDRVRPVGVWEEPDQEEWLFSRPA